MTTLLSKIQPLIAQAGSTKWKRSDNEASAADSDEDGANSPPEEPSTSRFKPKVQRVFNADWLDQFEWLSFDKEASKMFCTTCTMS
ncbi:hypothetical protein BaRGS_00000371 [Batillaria attramentaria]|uniref:Uncharacterized protein n=1 Tax=Batillaria attramentaria TaxID=370345 RepID=A0ABD0M994_9CAEN